MRSLIAAGLVVLMLVFGILVYRTAGLLARPETHTHRPSEVSAPALAGTMYVVQGGAIFRFHKGAFTQITSEGGWTQPAVAPGGSDLVAVRRSANFSDLYLLSTGGRQLAQLTHDNVPGPIENQHWSFYPRFSPDGSTLFYDYDPKNRFNSYQVDLAIFASPSNPGSQVAVQWTHPNEWTGGDVDPLPLRGGGLVYTKYSIDEAFHVHSQVWIQLRAGSAGKALTNAENDCAQPAVSPDETMIAMVCSNGSNQNADLDVATFDLASQTVGSPTALVSKQLVASPVFSPDAKTLAFLAPVTAGGQFQLWTVEAAKPASVRAITKDLGLDSTSPPVWIST